MALLECHQSNKSCGKFDESIYHMEDQEAKSEARIAGFWSMSLGSCFGLIKLVVPNMLLMVNLAGSKAG